MDGQDNQPLPLSASTSTLTSCQSPPRKKKCLVSTGSEDVGGGENRFKQGKGVGERTEEGGDKNEGQARNPLDIPEIVANVASYIYEYKDLRSVRVLNTFWRDETLTKWRNTAVFLINKDTIPLLCEAFSDNEEEKKDPFRLKDIPFKKYRFTSNPVWVYPLDEDDTEGICIWEKCISPLATYVDAGECCIVRYYYGYDEGGYVPGLKWILEHCPNVTELAMAPFKAPQAPYDEYDSVDEEGMDQDEIYAYRMADRLPILQVRRDFTVPLLQSLTIYSPISKFIRKNFEPVFTNWNDKEWESTDTASSVIAGMMPNLKTLELPTKGGGDAILYGLRDSEDEATRARIKLESLTAFGVRSSHWGIMGPLVSFSRHTPYILKFLRLSLDYYWVTGEIGLYEVLTCFQATLVKLELDVSSDLKRRRQRAEEEELQLIQYIYLKSLSFPNLTHFKVCLDYISVYGSVISFDLNDLRKMPKLQEFHFGTSKNQISSTEASSLITRKINFLEVQPNPVPPPPERGNFWTDFVRDPDGRYVAVPRQILINPIGEQLNAEKLPDLKSFHFHGNISKEAVEVLGKLMENLETFEIVFDEETFPIIGDTWPTLKNLRLLEGSKVPEEQILSLLHSNTSLNITDNSDIVLSDHHELDEDEDSSSSDDDQSDNE